MLVHFQYSVIYDLMYHMLAHTKVENASNLYSEEYIQRISNSKNETESTLCKEVDGISEYYNDNFERLGIINFLPCYCSSLQELQNALLTYSGFTEEDRQAFTEPLCSIIEKEFVFYNDYWSKRYSKTLGGRNRLEQWLKGRFSPYEPLFLYFEKRINIGFSFALTRNGRGYYQKDAFSAIVPFKAMQNTYENTFYQLLHEFTHQFTDSIVGTDIKMKDGTHTVSENAAILFDYYLIRTLYPEDLSSYYEWIRTATDSDCRNEDSIVSGFPVDNGINERLLQLTNDITHYRSQTTI